MISKLDRYKLGTTPQQTTPILTGTKTAPPRSSNGLPGEVIAAANAVRKVRSPRSDATMEDSPPSDLAHIAPGRVTEETSAPTLCGGTGMAGDDPENVALLPTYRWCVRCMSKWKKTHGRTPTLKKPEAWQLEKFNAWLTKWREKRVAKVVARDLKRSADRRNKEAPAYLNLSRTVKSES